MADIAAIRPSAWIEACRLLASAVFHRNSCFAIAWLPHSRSHPKPGCTANSLGDLISAPVLVNEPVSFFVIRRGALMSKFVLIDLKPGAGAGSSLSAQVPAVAKLCHDSDDARRGQTTLSYLTPCFGPKICFEAVASVGERMVYKIVVAAFITVFTGRRRSSPYFLCVVFTYYG